MERTTELATILRSYLDTPSPGTVLAQLDPPQVAVIEGVERNWREGETRTRIKGPTGTGKTLYQAALLEALFPEQLLDEAQAPRVLIVEPTRFLIHQTAREFGDRIPHIPVGKYYSDEKDLTKPVTLITCQSLVRRLADGTIRPEDFSMIFYDEVHHMLSELRRKSVDEFDHAVQVGFTATPGFGANRHVREILPAEASRMSIRDGVENNLLCSFSVFIVRTDTDLLNVSVIGQGENRDFNLPQLDQKVNNDSRNQLAVDLYKNNFDNELAVASCTSVAHAKALSELFTAQGVPAAFIHGRQSSKEQEEILEAWEKGEVKVLASKDLLIEGLNQIKASVLFNLRPTLSPRVAEQRGGRVLRLDRENPKKYAYIFDFIDIIRNTAQIPISFAQSAEAAAIVNSWYLSYSTSTPNNAEIPTLMFAPSNVITDQEEIMWAVNNQYRRPGELPPLQTEWKTLQRIAAEVGIPAWGLQRFLARMGSQFLSTEDVKFMETPNGNGLAHYNAEAFYKFLEQCFGMTEFQKLITKREGKKGIAKEVYLGYVIDRDLDFLDQYFSLEEQVLARRYDSEFTSKLYGEMFNLGTQHRTETSIFRYFLGHKNWHRMFVRLTQVLGEQGIVIEQSPDIQINTTQRVGNKVLFNTDQHGVIKVARNLLEEYMVSKIPSIESRERPNEFSTLEDFILERIGVRLKYGIAPIRDITTLCQLTGVRYLLASYFSYGFGKDAHAATIESCLRSGISREDLKAQRDFIKRTAMEIIDKIDPRNLRAYVPNPPTFYTPPEKKKTRVEEAAEREAVFETTASRIAEIYKLMDQPRYTMTKERRQEVEEETTTKWSELVSENPVGLYFLENVKEFLENTSRSYSIRKRFYFRGVPDRYVQKLFGKVLDNYRTKAQYKSSTAIDYPKAAERLLLRFGIREGLKDPNARNLTLSSVIKTMLLNANSIFLSYDVSRPGRKRDSLYRYQMSPRTLTVLRNHGIDSMHELDFVGRNYDLASFYDVGPKTIVELQRALDFYRSGTRSK